MRLFCYNIFSVVKYSSFIVVFVSMLIQPIMKTIALFASDDIELVEVDWEEDFDEEEKQEDDCKDEKNEFKILNSYDRHFIYASECFCYQVLQPHYDFNLEIPIPPPEQV
ncbi:hypothetical protein ATO12_16235 [Aquimarina atlantica]|uniref:Uncharacterized protein n=1 Tax=Aquimarina atlantica TaxID=1317122 RepID=A0A023BU31_9FLAO|nr:hypothetical protein [Aquimarina atlantica]EZH73485.1 hypothetical protein ATO12_16235 [Aquimarina atlantica]